MSAPRPASGSFDVTAVSIAGFFGLLIPGATLTLIVCLVKLGWM
jgi:hypothetical protein